MISLRLLVESILDEHVLRKLLAHTNRYAVDACDRKGGKANLKKVVQGYNQAAQGYPYFFLVDLDDDECPIGLINRWLPRGKHPNLLLRVAVREVESWLLADREGLSRFLRVKADLFPRIKPDEITKPKEMLVALAQKSESRSIREAIVPDPKSTSKVGPDYNGQLSKFVDFHWNLESAMQHSDSLFRAYQAFLYFEPIYPDAK